MRKIFQTARWPGAFLAAFFWSHGLSAADAVPVDERVLLIYGTGGVATWEQNFNRTFFNEIGSDAGLYLDPEFLSLVDATAAERELIARSLALKYGDQEFAVVMATLPEANQFVVEWKHLFAPDAAVVHVLPGEDVMAEASSLPDRAVLDSAADDAVVETAAVIPRLFPDLEHIYVTAGSGVADNIYLARYRNALENAGLSAEIHYLQGLLPEEELLPELARVPPNSAVIMATYDLDRLGRTHRSLVVTRLLAENLDMPVFGMIDTLPVNGSIGGSVVSTASYAFRAVDLVRGALQGEFPDAPVTGTTRYLFNGAKLDQFDVSRGLLPPDSTIINDPPNLWRDYYPVILGGSSVILVQLLLIGLLLKAVRRRKRAEAQLEETRKREALGALAGGIAHDFNNILMTIVANTELASLDNSDKALEQRFSAILSASDRARNLVKQILMFSRQSAPSDSAPVDLCAQLEESVGQIQTFLPASCVTDIDCQPDLPPISFDATQLHQIILNLCVNAQHAMESAGTIRLIGRRESLQQPRRLLHQTAPAGDYVTMIIEDTGSGISAEDLKQVFTPFFTTKPSGQGTGLGLPLVYNIIRAHGAYIDMESRLGFGTTVTLYFQMATKNSETVVPRHEATLSRGNGERILLVDDDAMVLDANRQILEGLDYRVSAFGHSREALACFEKNPEAIDIVLTDLSMPEMDGVRLIETIRKLRPGLPCLVCSGYLESANALDMNNCQILSKPVSVNELSRALDEALHPAWQQPD